MPKVLIAGCGYIGTELGLQLARAGHQVWGLRRNPEGLPSELHPLRADLANPANLVTLPEGLDFVFYTAAATGYSDEAYRQAYVEGLRNLLKALVAQNQAVRRVFFTSSTGVYAQAAGEWVDESSPARSTHFSGARLLQAEALLHAAPFPSTVLRLAGIYGPGRTQTIDRVRDGSAVLHEGAPQYMNHIHRDDAAGVLAHLITLPAPDPLYLGVDSDPADRREVLTWLASVLGVSAPRTTAPAANASSSQRGNKRCRNSRILSTDYAFLYPSYREGYLALLSGASEARA